MIPLQYKIGAVVVLILSAYIFGRFQQHLSEQAKQQAAELAQMKKNDDILAQREVVAQQLQGRLDSAQSRLRSIHDACLDTITDPDVGRVLNLEGGSEAAASESAGP